VSAAAVFLEGIVVSDAAQQGILDRRTSGQTRLYITDSIVRNNTGAGIVAAASGGGMMVLDNVRSENNAYGIAVATGNNVTINRSVLSGNSAAGVEGDGGAQVIVNNSIITNNNIGVESSLSVRLSNNDIAFNNTAVSGASGTFGNNRFSGNGSIGTAPAPLGGASSDIGQQ
jgi:parallel beta helix pectate lyase-like protein